MKYLRYECRGRLPGPLYPGFVFKGCKINLLWIKWYFGEKSNYDDKILICKPYRLIVRDDWPIPVDKSSYDNHNKALQVMLMLESIALDSNLISDRKELYYNIASTTDIMIRSYNILVERFFHKKVMPGNELYSYFTIASAITEYNKLLKGSF